ncbi:MAG: hypothetical protein ACFFBP_08560 [Promethearchaeota archaeon]
MRKNQVKYNFFVIFLIFSFIMTAILLNSSNFNNQFLDESSFSEYSLKTNSSELNITTPLNITYTAPMSGYYPATLGFENDTIGSDPSGWQLEEYAGDIQIIEEIGGYKKVVRLNDNSGSGFTKMSKIFASQESGTVEVWLRFTDVTRYCTLALDGDGGATTVMRVITGSDNWRIYNLGQWVDITRAFIDTWSHVRIDFECTTNGYEGLSQYQYFVYINGIRYGPFVFQNNVLTINNIRIKTDHMGYGYSLFCDAIGFSWDPNYVIGDNVNEGLLLSYEKSTVLDWMGYSLDGAANITIQGNTTIPMPSDPGLHSIQVFGNDTSGIMQSSDIRYFIISGVKLITPENITYTTPMGGYYPATYGFENDQIGSNPLGFEVLEGSYSSVNVIGGDHTHRQIVELRDGSSSEVAELKRIFTNSQSFGTIEFWFKTSDITQRTEFILYSGGSTFLYFIWIYLYNDQTWMYADSGGVHHPIPYIARPQNDKWQHWTIHFRCDGAAEWKGLGFNRWKAIVDNVDSGELQSRSIESQTLDFRIHTSLNDAYNLISYVDAIGFSWDPNYVIGDNVNEGILLSYENTTILDWMGYSLDGAANITIQGNTTISMPTGNGMHSIQVFGTTPDGYIFPSDKRYFSLDWEYICLRPSLNILDMNNECGMYIEIELNSIGFLHVNNFSFTIPIIIDYGYNPSTFYIYEIDLYGANFIEDTSILSSITIRFYYDPLKINDPLDLKLYHYISSLGQWHLEDFSLNSALHYIEITTNELSYFSLTETDIPITPFPWFLIIIIIILSVIGITVPTGYVAISRKKKKKDRTYKPLNKKEPLTREISTLHDEEFQPMKSIKPQITPEMLTPIRPKELKEFIKVKKAKKTIETNNDPKILKIVLSEKEIEEIGKTEKEIEIEKEIDRCIVHKGHIKGLSYVCPKCYSKYCINCAQAFEERNEPCWVCKTPINLKQKQDNNSGELNKIVKIDVNESYRIKTENIMKRLQSGGNLTTISDKFWEDINKFDWDDNDKEEFIKEMLSLTPKERQNIVDLMLREKNKSSLPK